jgi:hypothetical protein
MEAAITANYPIFSNRKCVRPYKKGRDIRMLAFGSRCFLVAIFKVSTWHKLINCTCFAIIFLFRTLTVHINIQRFFIDYFKKLPEFQSPFSCSN